MTEFQVKSAIFMHHFSQTRTVLVPGCCGCSKMGYLYPAACNWNSLA